MKYKSATSPRYVDAERTGIAMDVVFILKEGVAEVPAIPPSATSRGQAAIPAVLEVLSAPWPFFAVSTDVETHGRELYIKAVAGNFGPIAAYVPAPPPPPVVPFSITRRQCALQLLAENRVTNEEAIAMVVSSSPPPIVAALFAKLTPNERTRATIDFAANIYERNNPLITSFMTAAGKSASDADAFFIAAAKL